MQITANGWCERHRKEVTVSLESKISKGHATDRLLGVKQNLEASIKDVFVEAPETDYAK